MKKINFQQLLLEKGERIGLCVAGGLAVILLALTLFMPGKGLFSGSASAHIEELTKLNTNLKSKHQAARPVDNDKPPDLKDALVKFDHRLFDASEFPNHPGFFTPPPTDTKRHKPTLLLCDEFQVAVLVGSFPALQVKFDDVGGKRVITHIEVVESSASEGGSTPGYTPGTLQTDQFKKGPGGSMGFRPPGGGSGPGAGRPGTTNPYQGMYRAAQQHTRFSKPRNKTALLPVNEAQGKTPTIGALPERIAIIAASFPYRQQIEEFKRALHLPTVGAVLTEYVRGEKNKSWPSFGFDGVEVERMTLNEDGSDGQWEPLDVVEAYKQFFILTNRSVEKDKADYKPILAASRGLVMPVPAQLPEDLKSGKHSAAREVPDLLDKLDNIKKTLEKVKQASTKDIVPPSNPLTDTSFNPFDTEASTGGGKPTPGVTPPMPPTGTDPDSKYGSFYGNTEWQKKIGDDTPLDHCLVRFVDVHLEPGKFYKYRFKVRMMNPNYAPEPKARKDTYPQFAQDRVLTSDWSTVPQVVTVPPDQQVYALNLPDNWKLVNAELKKQEPWRWTFRPGGSPPRQEPSQAAVQIHRWVDYYRPNPDEPRLQAVGEWLVAARILVERGEYVHDPAYKVPVPIKPTDLFEHELDNNPKLNKGAVDKPLMNVEFGDETVLVDFEGGETRFTRTETRDEKTKTVLVEDSSAVEMLMTRPDGKVIALNSATDGATGEKVPPRAKERETRAQAFIKRIEDLRKSGKEPYDPLKGGPMPPK